MWQKQFFIILALTLLATAGASFIWYKNLPSIPLENGMLGFINAHFVRI